jgi:hypothetical protein
MTPVSSIKFFRKNYELTKTKGDPACFSWGLAILPQPNQQNKTKQLCWCGIIIGKKPTTPPHHHHTTTPDVITF